MKPNTKYLLIITTLERLYAKKFASITKLQRSSFTSDLQANGLDVAKGNLLLSLINPDILTTLKGLYRRVGVQGARMTYNDLKAQVKEGQKASGFGRNERWIAEVLRYLQTYGLQFAAYISDTIKEDILKVLETAVEEGWSIDKIVYELSNSKLPAVRARVIARTELVRAMNVGHTIGAKELPFEVNKKWSAASDFRTRNSHKLVNGHITDEDGTFNVPVYKGKVKVGVEKMLFPGDPKASASNVINCRCRVLYEAKRDSKGNLIRRSTSATIIPFGATLPARIPGSTRIAAELKSWLADRITVDVDMETE